MTAPSTETAQAQLPDGERLRELIARYDRPGPRYTSYPTVPEWSEQFGRDEFREALRACRAQQLSLYVHIPFCERLCSFCACNRKITRDHSVAGPYLSGIELEASALRDELAGEPRVVQLAIGGGSPNFLSPRELQRLIDSVDGVFPPALASERSIELDPRGTSRAQLEVLAERGFNRLSLGVQDTSPVVQRAINRIQSNEQIQRLVSEARELGMRSTSFDLIYGLPYQTERSFDSTLERVLELRPDRIALYSYAHVTWISKAQRGFERKDLPGPEQKLRIFQLAIERLTRAGYDFLGLDHFALPEDELAQASSCGELRRNFMGYTTRAGLDLIALGASGISELESAYAQSLHDPDAWLRTVRSGHLATARGHRLSGDDQQRRWLIQRLMCQGEIDPAAFQERFAIGLRDALPELEGKLAPFLADDLLARRGEVWQVTATGRLFLRVIAMAFDPYLGAPDGQRPRFSRAL